MEPEVAARIMADAVDRAEDTEETATMTDAEVAEETVTVVEEAVEEFDDSSSKIKDNININIITVILPKDIQAARNGGFLFHKSPSRAMARGHSCASSKTAHVGSIQDGDGIWSRLQPTCCSLL